MTVKISPHVSSFNRLRAQYPFVFSLDIHSGSTYVYGVDVQSGEILYDGNIPGDFYHAFSVIHRIDVPHFQTLFLYEAGNQGFTPYREAVKSDYNCLVIAPHSLPGRRNRYKTDRADAVDNLSSYQSGHLRYATVPEREKESARDLLRHRNHIQKSITQSKNRAVGLSRRSSEEFTGSKCFWTKTHRHWLSTLSLGRADRFQLQDILDSLTFFEGRLKRLDDELDDLVQSTPHWEKLYLKYLLLPGVGRIYSLTFVFEGPDFRQFPHPKNLMSYCGLLQARHDSGKTISSLGISKTGNPHLRRAFVGVAKVYSDMRRKIKEDILTTYDREDRAFVIKAQDRLFKRYRSLKSKDKHTNKVRCAIARELCGFLWEMTIKL